MRKCDIRRGLVTCAVTGFAVCAALFLGVRTNPYIVNAQAVVGGAASGRSHLVWRTSETAAGQSAVFGRLGHFECTEHGLFAFDEQLQTLLRFAADGSAIQAYSVEGEAPGHVNMIVEVSVGQDGASVAIQQGPMPARTVMRTPIAPPFDSVESIEFPGAEGSLRSGVSVRVAGTWVVAQWTEQKLRDLSERHASIRAVNRASGEYYELLHEPETASGWIGEGTSAYWVWTVDEAGTLYLSDDHDVPVVRAIDHGGAEVWRVDMGVEPVSKTDSLVAKVQASYDQLSAAGWSDPIEAKKLYRAIVDIAARDGFLYVLTSSGIGRGLLVSESIHWQVVDAGSGKIVGSVEVTIPKEGLHAIRATCDGLRAYVLASDVSGEWEPEVLAFDVQVVRRD